jgi:tripartite-type tricarboxylate transporter receptor subunit TctC
MEESGLPSFDMSNAVGLVAPRGTPEAVITRLAEAATRATADPAVHETFVQNGAELRGLPAEDYARYVHAERARFAEVIRVTGVRLE